MFTFSDKEKIVSLDRARPHSIMIFDDVICDKQTTIRDYFCMGRHKHIDSLCLRQTYTKIPKHLIRDNANLIIIFKKDEMIIRHLYSDHVIGDMTFKQFIKIWEECWKQKYEFVLISKDNDTMDGIEKDSIVLYIYKQL